MSSTKATEILNQFYADERIYMSQPSNQQDPALLANTLSPRIKLYQTPDLPYGGTYEGIEGFLAWGKKMGSYFDTVDVQPSKVLEDGDDVIVLSTLRLRVRRTGRVIENPFVQHIRVDREAGKLLEFRPFYWDVRGLSEALNEG
jgi:ketosteroid isomerase-like protein